MIGARYRVKYVLVDVLETTQQVIPESAWEEEERIDAGRYEEHTVQYKLSQRVKIEEVNAATLESTFGLKPPQIAGFQAGLKSAVERRLALTEETSTEQSVTRTRVYTLPDEPADPSVTHVKARSYQYAQIHRDLLCSVTRSCTCCGLEDRLVVKIPLQLAKIATRQVDFLSDETVKKLRTSDNDVGPS
jgi:hypothetical protein